MPALEAAGHRVRALTLPGLESKYTDRSAISLRDHVDAVVAEIDAADGPVVLVGHSAGGAVAYAAADARPDRVARVVYVASEPLGDGLFVNDGFPAEHGEIPLPDWSVFDEEMLTDLDDDLRETMRDRSVPSPERVATDRQQLSDERRWDVPATVITCVYMSNPGAAELGRIYDVTYVDLPTGHWPQFTRPAELARIIIRTPTTATGGARCR